MAEVSINTSEQLAINQWDGLNSNQLSDLYLKRISNWKDAKKSYRDGYEIILDAAKSTTNNCSSGIGELVDY